jgi:hypothetical protein
VQVTPGSQNINVANNQTLDLAPGSYGSLTMGKSSVLRLRAGQYAFSSITTEQSSIQIDLDPDGDGEPEAIVIGVSGNVFFKSTSRVEVTSAGGAEQVLFRVAGASLQAHPKASLVGTYLAPSATVLLQTDAELTGMIYGRTVQIYNGARLTWAPALDVMAGP